MVILLAYAVYFLGFIGFLFWLYFYSNDTLGDKLFMSFLWPVFILLFLLAYIDGCEM